MEWNLCVVRGLCGCVVLIRALYTMDAPNSALTFLWTAQDSVDTPFGSSSLLKVIGTYPS